MLEAHLCRDCGEPLPQDAPSGHCPSCLLRIGLAVADGGLALGLDVPSAEPSQIANQKSPIKNPTVRYVGDYELLEEIGRGGMGVVYKARQVSLNRPVALKLIRAGDFADQKEVARFRAEAAAHLDHPNIVPIYEVGEHEGRHYFSMKLVEAGSLAERMAKAGNLQPSTRDAAKLLATVARAVHYAHQRGVLHRDLKPGNILLDASGQPHLTDFGLAKRIEGDAGLTLSGAILGTPNYMAPEQAAAAKALSTAADVYSLGAILYELLTSRPPFHGATVLETLMQVKEREPTPPSTLVPHLDRDIEVICLKCLEKEPNHRYRSAEALAEDLERWLAREPIQARPGNAWERAMKFARRKPAQAAFLVGVPLSLVLGLTTTLWQWCQSERHAKEETVQRRLAERNELAIRQSLYAADMNLVPQVLAQQNLGRARELLRAYEPQAGQPDLRGWEWWYWSKECQGGDIFSLQTNGNYVTTLVACPRLNGTVMGWVDGTVELWDLAAQKPIAPLAKLDRAIEWLTTDVEGRFLATSIPDGPIQVWDLTDIAKVKRISTLPEKGQLLALSSHKSLIAIGGTTAAPPDIPGSDFELVTLCDYASGKKLRTLPKSGQRAVFSRDGGTLVTGSYKGTSKIWNTEDWSLRKTLPATGKVFAMDLSPDDRLLVTSSWEGNVLLWNVASGEAVGSFKGHSSRVRAVRFSPDGQLLATASADQTIGLWDVSSQRELLRLRGHDNQVSTLTFSQDGKWLASAGFDGAMRIWKVDPSSQTNRAVPIFSPPVFTPDSRGLVAADERGSLGLWDATTKQRKATLPGEPNPLGFTSDGKLLITASVATSLPFYPNTISGLKSWELGSSTLKSVVAFSPSNRKAGAIALSPDGNTVVTGDLGTNVTLWDARTGMVREELCASSKRVWNLVFSRDGAMLAIGAEGSIRVWDVRNRKTLFDVAGSALPVAFSPDGGTLATGAGNQINLWRTPAGELLRTLKGHREGIYWLAFSKDGRTLASACEEIKLWSLATGREIAHFRQDAPFVFVTFSPDGRSMLGGRVGEAYTWTADGKDVSIR